MKIISIVIPVFQNALNLDTSIETLAKLRQKFQAMHYELEIIFVEDGSHDNSYNVLKKYAHNPYITIIKLTRNFGQIPAIQAGLNYVNGEYIGIISADLQDPPELFLTMLNYLENGSKIVIAEREEREESLYRKITSRLYWGMIQKFSMKNFPMGGFDFCMFNKQVLKQINTVHEKNTNIFPFIFWLGYEPKILKYKRLERTEGKSTWTFFKKLKLTIDTIIGFTYLPTRFLSISALLTSLLAFGFSFFILSSWAFGLSKAPDGWTTIAMLILIIGGIILFGLGVIGEYLLRILDEVRNRPNYVIDEIHNKEKD